MEMFSIGFLAVVVFTFIFYGCGVIVGDKLAKRKLNRCDNVLVLDSDSNRKLGSVAMDNIAKEET